MEKAAVNAVMAGCLPEYFPVVVAALEACFDQAFNLNTVLTSTGGAAIAVVVSGPIAAEMSAVAAVSRPSSPGVRPRSIIATA